MPIGTKHLGDHATSPFTFVRVGTYISEWLEDIVRMA